MGISRDTLVAELTASQDILSRARAGESAAILDLGKAKRLSPAVRATLEKWAQADDKAYGSGAVFARMVLARHGDNERFEEIKKELLTGDGFTQVYAIEKLVYINDMESVRLIGPFLERDDAPFRGHDVLMRPFSFYAVAALCQIVAPPKHCIRCNSRKAV